MLKLKVPDMSCDHCVSTIEKAVKAADATAAIEADLESQVVSVRSRLEPEAISKAIAAAGYASERIVA